MFLGRFTKDISGGIRYFLEIFLVLNDFDITLRTCI